MAIFVLGLAAWTLLCGCAHVSSTTVRKTDPETGVITETTRVRAFALFDSHNSILTLRNQSGYSSPTNRYSPGTYIGGLNQESTSTNLASVISALAEGVVKGLK